jgi:hypothetical protein
MTTDTFHVVSDTCVHCGTGLFLSAHVDDLDRRQVLEPYFEDKFLGYCEGCYKRESNLTWKCTCGLRLPVSVRGGRFYVDPEHFTGGDHAATAFYGGD